MGGCSIYFVGRAYPQNILHPLLFILFAEVHSLTGRLAITQQHIQATLAFSLTLNYELPCTTGAEDCMETLWTRHFPSKLVPQRREE
jgi:hypothetical protein